MLKQFYEKALPSQGVYCVSGIDQATKKTQNRFAETLEDVFKLVDKLKDQNLNVFVAPGSFEGFSRKSNNSLFFRSFFIDLDVSEEKAKEGRGYASKDGALEALNKFVTDTELPSPVILDSGTGIHGYWLLDSDIPTEEYLVYAIKFKTFVIKQLHADASVMADPARIMRCPETLNYKTNPPSPTCILNPDQILQYSFESFKEFLDNEIVNDPGDVFSKVKKGLDEDTLALKKQDNFDWEFAKIAIRSIEGDGCNQVKYVLENSKTLEEPMWFAGLSIAKFCSDGATAIHELSNDHPDYKYEDTEEKANRFPAPRTCEWFNDNYPDRCKNCKHKGSIKSPISLGKIIKIEPVKDTQDAVRQDEDTEEVPKFPEFLKPFYRGVNGGIYYDQPPKKNKQGKTEYFDPLCLLVHDFFPVRRLVSPMDGECMTMRLVLPNDGIKDFLLPMRVVASLEELKKVLSFNHVIFETEHAIHLQKYLIKWDQYMIMTGRAQTMRMQLGWTESKDSDTWDKRRFVLGGIEMDRQGEETDAPYSPYIKSIIKYMKPMGTFEKWQECANQLNRPGFELHAMMCLAGFGSVLMAYMTTPGVVISLLGRSGSAKTGAMYAGISTFGNPTGLSVFESTDMGLTQRMLVLKNLMFGVDEIGNKDPKPLSQLTHNVSSGKAKIRLQASVNAEREHEMSASQIAVFTTNESVYTKFEILKGAPDGEAARLIEFLIVQPDSLMGDEGSILGRKIFNPFKSNYGHAGPMFLRELFKLSDEYIDSRIEYWIEKYVKNSGGDSAYRFHENFVAAVMTAGEIVVSTGILDYDLDRIFNRMVKELENIRLNVIKVNNTDYPSLLNDFLYENMGNILRIKDGKIIDEPRGKLVGRIANDEPTRISKEALKEYLNKKKITPREFEKAMLESGDMLDKAAKKHLETGWKPTTGKNGTNVYLFKESHLLDDTKADH